MTQAAPQPVKHSHIKLRSIQTKLTLAIILILIPIVALISFVSYRNTQSLLEGRTFELIGSIAIEKQERLNIEIKEKLEMARTLASNPKLLEITSTPSALPTEDNVKIDNRLVLDDLLIYYPQFQNIWIIDNEGETIVSTEAEGASSQTDISITPIITDRFSIRTTEGEIFINGPLFKDGRQMGVIFIKIDKQEILQSLNDYTGLGTSGEILLGRRDKDRVILLNKPRYENRKQMNKISIREHPRAPIVLATQHLSGTTIALSRKNIEVLADYRYLASYDWGLVVQVDKNEAFLPLTTLKEELLRVSVLTLLLFVLVAFVVSRSITEPLHRLHLGTEKISQGNWDYSFDIKTGDEVEQLADEFTSMAQELKALYESLEKKVKDRTSELEREKEVSERLAADLEKFRLAVENASDMIIITDADDNIIYANKIIETQTGYQPQEVIGKNPRELWVRQDESGNYEKMYKKVKIEKKTSKVELKNIKKDGTQYIAEVSITPLLDLDSKIRFFVRVEHDITKAREIDRMKTEFISIASHQLRTPLSAIKWFTEMLLAGDAGKLNSEQNEYIEQVYSSNQRMIELVNALLNISRIEQGRIAIEPILTDLGKLVDEVLTELQPKIMEKKLNVVVSKHEKLPKISVDRKLIRQVYANLLSNAVKYTPNNGEIMVIISRKGKEIISQIKDTGLGIPVDQQSRVFTKFFRADNIRNVAPDGSGLGLYVVKSVVESSGGKVWFKTQENKGTTFWFTLPIAGTPPRKGERTLEEIHI